MKTTKKKTVSTPRRLELMPLDEIKAAKKNPRDHDLGMLAEGILTRGLGELPLLDERTGRLVAGHGRLETLRALRKDGNAPPDGVQLANDGEWLVPVIRGWASSSDADAAAYLVGSNQAPVAGGWHEDELNALLVEIAKQGEHHLQGTGFDGDDVDRMLKEITRTAASDAAENEPDPEPTKIYVKEGDLWRCGSHFVACGDSLGDETQRQLFTEALERETVDAVVTDPPYAIYGSSTGIGADITDDKMVAPFFEKVLTLAARRLPTFGQLYGFCDWRSYSAWWQAAKRSGLTPKNCIVWDKGGAGLGSMWAMTHEFVVFLQKSPKATSMKGSDEKGARTVFRSNVLHYNRVTGDEREHNAAKPVELLVELVEAATDKGGIVWDPFCGSGSTMIACEKSGRRRVTADTEPKWVQVAIERWARKSGGKPQKMGGAS